VWAALFGKRTRLPDGRVRAEITPKSFQRVRQYSAQCVGLVIRELTHPHWPRKPDADHIFDELLKQKWLNERVPEQVASEQSAD
jgi:hypothetical protein